MKPSAEYIRERFHYDAVSGELRWRPVEAGNDPKKRTWNTRYAGSLAGKRNDHGYLTVRLDGSFYHAHQLIWAWSTGEWPSKFIDHIDHDRKNNRIENLRQVCPTQNARNASLSRSNTSGVNGVCWRRRENKWGAYITVNRKVIHLGLFATKGEAAAVRLQANRHHGFHENHGMPA